MTLASPARIHLLEACGLTLGPQQLTASEQDFKLSWWDMREATAAADRFLLPDGPLALMLTQAHAPRLDLAQP